MTKRILLICFFSFFVSTYSQNKQILYDFTGVPQSLMLNPGSDVNYKFYIGIPFLSGFSTHAGVSGFSASDLFLKDGVNFNDKFKSFLSSIKNTDFANINQQLELVSGGLAIGKEEKRGYLSFGIYQELDFFAFFPKDIIALSVYGNENEIGKKFNFSDLNFKGDLSSVFHLGFHKRIANDLIIGSRFKVYSSIININSTQNNGDLLTDPSTYKQTLYSKIAINTSGAANYNDDNFATNFADNLTKKFFLGGNLGFGVDLGLTYNLEDNIQLTASVLDLGAIKHTKEIKNYNYLGFYSFSNPIDIVGQELPEKEYSYNSYTTWRPLKFNSSIRYSFDEKIYSKNNESSYIDSYSINVYESSVGAQLFMMSTSKSPIVALTGFYEKKFSDKLNVKLTYTLDSFSYTNIGLGFSSKLGPVNFYILGDNLIGYTNLNKMNSLSLQFGLNLIFKE
ncbi:MAG: hypothetical protein KA210_01825 [Bacteroidia bacterium]|nr:hypothetical protein [Bacteroidia bacterium]